MSTFPDKERYMPGDPRSFGKSADPSGLEELSSLFNHFYSTPSAEMRLSHGQDPSIQACFQLMKRDRLLSSFPEVQEGVKFLEKVLPTFIKELTMDDQLSSPGLQPKITISDLEINKKKFFSQLLFDFFAGKEEIEEGGQETGYIMMDQPPKEQSYEYIGEKLTRLIRARVHDDKDPKTRAFFGWIGRHLMKKICPETDFSLDRHNKMVDKEKKKMADTFKKFREKLEKSIDGDLTSEKAYGFFGELRNLADFFARVDSAGTPLAVRVSGNLRINFDGFDDIYKYLPYEESDIFHNTNTFSMFLQNWQEVPSKDFNYREYYRKKAPKVFEDVSKDDSARTISKEQLLPKWFEMHKTILLEETEWIAKDAQDFNVTYFRFIRNNNIAAGYVYAEEYKDEIFANLPDVLKLTEEEVQARFMQGKPKILHDEYDSGKNSAADSYRDVNFEEMGEPLAEIIEEATPPPIVLTEEEKARTDEDWLNVIINGPNARLYEELKAYGIFSSEEWLLGVHPLFFGNWLSDEEANLAYAGKLKAFYASHKNLAPIEVEKKRIEEFKAGIFSPPKNYEDLIVNASRQLIRLQSEFNKCREQVTTFNVDAIAQASILQERMIAIRRVKNTIKEIIAQQKKE